MVGEFFELLRKQVAPYGCCVVDCTAYYCTEGSAVAGRHWVLLLPRLTGVGIAVAGRQLRVLGEGCASYVGTSTSASAFFVRHG